MKIFLLKFLKITNKVKTRKNETIFDTIDTHSLSKLPDHL